MSSRLAIREISESEEISYYLSCYQSGQREENQFSYSQIALAFWVTLLVWYLLVSIVEVAL